MRLLLTRPLDDSLALAEKLEAAGHRCLVEPLLAITCDLAAPLELAGVAALLFTSANGVRAFALRSPRRDLPVFAVGPATASAARKLGFADIATAGGDVQALVRMVREMRSPDDGTLLHVRGREVAGDLEAALRDAGFSITHAVLYAAEPAREFSVGALAALRGRQIDGVVIYSPRSAAIFTRLIKAAELREAMASVVLFGLSQAVIDEAKSLPWSRRIAATTPDEAGIIAAIGDGEAKRLETMESKTETSAPPPPRKPFFRTSWALPALLILVLAGLPLALNLIMQRRAPEPVAAAPDHAPRIAELEAMIRHAQQETSRTHAEATHKAQAQLATIERRLGDIAATLEAMGTRAGKLETELRAEIQRLGSLASDSQTIAATNAETKRVDEDLRRLQTQFAGLGQSLAEQRARARSDRVVEIAVRLRVAFAADEALDTLLGELVALVESDERLRAATQRVRQALSGIPALDSIRRSFASAATDALRATRLAAVTGWRASATEILLSYVQVRRVGDVAGTDVEAIVARAELRLSGGDLAAAIELVSGLKEPAANSFTGWLSAARARAVVDEALREIHEIAAKR